MAIEQIKEKIKRFLSTYMREHDLCDDDDIFALGFVNSLFAMQFVLFVEREFNITVENEDLEIDNFRSVNAITNLIEQKTAMPVQY